MINERRIRRRKRGGRGGMIDNGIYGEF